MCLAWGVARECGGDSLVTNSISQPIEAQRAWQRRELRMQRQARAALIRGHRLDCGAMWGMCLLNFQELSNNVVRIIIADMPLCPIGPVPSKWTLA